MCFFRGFFCFHLVFHGFQVLFGFLPGFFQVLSFFWFPFRFRFFWGFQVHPRVKNETRT
jgi:hypothetical protein